MNPSEEVLQRLPQKPPFLFVDSVLQKEESKIRTDYEFSGDEDFFRGHFPDMPVVPAVILQEALFQSGALLMSYMFPEAEGRGVVTRVGQGKFRQLVKPQMRVEMDVELVEEVGSAYFFKGKTYVEGKTVVALEFACSVA